MTSIRHRLAALGLTALLAACETVPLPNSPEASTTPPKPPANATAPVLTMPGVVEAKPVVTGIDAGTPVDPLRPEVHVDADDAKTHADLWVRVRRGFAMPELDTELVRDRERWYATRPDYVARMTERGSRYLFHIVEEVERRGMPTELALLPFIESAYNPQAMSTARASGMWQFIPSTGRDYALQQNIFRDDRRDVLASTRAALDYLQRLYGMFNDWQLALAAYNWGEGSVQRAIARNQRLGLPTDYLSLNMPNETRYYVPKLQAVKNIIARPFDFGLELPPLKNHPYFLQVGIERDIDVDVAARLASVPVEEFKTLNPQMNKPVILAAGTPQVLLPYDNANQFVQRLAAHRGPLATWTAWVAPRTLKLVDAARETGMSEESLREVNHIPPRMLIKAGSTLVVPRAAGAHANVSGDIADNASIALAPDVPPLRRLSFAAGRRGESVGDVARRYRVSIGQVAQWNSVTAASRFRAGQTVVVYVPASRAVKLVAATPAPATAPAPAARPAAKAAPRANRSNARPAAKAAAPVRAAAARTANKRVRVASGG